MKLKLKAVYKKHSPIKRLYNYSSYFISVKMFYIKNVNNLADSEIDEYLYKLEKFISYLIKIGFLDREGEEHFELEYNEFEKFIKKS